jgi:hypothetical protein
VNARLRPAECIAVKTSIFASVAAEPLDINAGATGIIDIGSFGAPDAVTPGVYAGGMFTGFFLRAQASNFNIVPGGTFDLQVFNVGKQTPELTATFRIDKGFAVFTAAIVVANQIAGRPRFSPRPIGVNGALGVNNTRAVISGGDTNYQYKARLFMPGDADTEALLNLL